MDTIVEIWEVLDEQLKKKCPKLFVTLNPGASEYEIATLESRIQLLLPNDLKESLRIHNGQHDPGGTHGIFNVQALLSCERIWDEYKLAQDIYNDIGPACYEKEPKGINCGKGWGDGWIPFAGFQASCTVTDILPAKDGKSGQVFETYAQQAGEILFPSVTAWLHWFAKAFLKVKVVEGDILLVDLPWKH